MNYNALLDFLANSVVEEFFMALFAWALLGKKEVVKFFHIVVAGLILAVVFRVFYIVFPNVTVCTILQVCAFIVTIYFVYKLDYRAAIVISLVTVVIVGVTQFFSVSIGLAVTGSTFEQYNTAAALKKSLYGIPEYVVVGVFAYIFRKKNITFLDFERKKAGKQNKLLQNKIRLLILHLSFTFLVILLNFQIVTTHDGLIKSNTDKVMVISNFSAILIFAAISIRSAFTMSDRIKKEEELKRKLDGREIIQNIDYLCRLMQSKEYNEVDNILKQMKDEVDRDMIK